MILRPSILVVEDDTDTATLVKFSLGKEGFEVLQASDGKSALDLARLRLPTTILLDLMLPEFNGWQVLSALKADPWTSATPVIILTAKVEVNDRVRGLEAGAQDYIQKPFSPRELVARVKTALRLTAGRERTPPLVLGEFVIDPFERRAAFEGTPLPLDALEFEILATLVSYPGRVLSKETLLESLWSHRMCIDERHLDAAIVSLRRKIERDPKDPEYILTIRGAGFQCYWGAGATPSWTD